MTKTKVKNPKLNNPIEKHFKEMSRYHYYLYALLFISKIMLYWHVMNLIFLSPPMKFYCNDGIVENLTDFENVCPCENPHWDRTVFTETFQTKFGVHCNNSWLLSFSQAAFYFGMLIGAVGFGFLSDRYGRLSMFLVCCFIILLFGSLVSAMPNIAGFIITRCIEGIGSGGGLVTNFVLCIEYCGLQHRELITAIFHLPGSFAHISLSGISYLLRDCDHFQLAISVPLLTILFYKRLIMESPKWLMDNDYIDEAVAVMQNFCRFNKKPCANIEENLVSYHSSHLDITKGRLWEIFKHKKLCIYFICMSVNYFVCGLGYYGVAQFIGKMDGNIHINVAISGALLIPGIVASIFLLKILPRRIFLMLTNILSGVSMMIVVCLSAHEVSYRMPRVAIASICNSSFYLSFVMVYLYAVELFPTSIRSSALGALSVFARLGQIITPPINELTEVTSGLVYGIMAIFAAVLCYPLPETRNVELPSSLQETKTLTRKTVKLVEDSEETPAVEA